MQNGNRKGIAQWSKTYAGKKFYTSILFLALPIILLVTFTFIPALDMVIFSFQNRDPYGTNPTYAGFSNYVTIFTDKDYLETFKNSLYYLVGSFIQQALALLLASILCSKIRAKGLFKGILFFPYLMNGVAVSIIFQRFFLKGQKGLTPDGTLNTILTTLGLDPILWFDVDRPFLANCCLVFISIWKYIGFDIIMYIGSRVLNIFKYAFLILCCLIVIVPILVVLIGSLKTYKELSNTTVFTLPEVPQWENFKTAFFTQNILLAFKNTAIIIVVSCVGSIITGTMTAYVVQRFNTYFSRTVKTAFLIATLLPNITMQVTVFQIVYKLGLYRSMLAPIILNIGTDIISIYIFIQFLGQISYSLDESAIMDGASYPRVYFSIILPNLKPAIATVLIIKFVGIYNDFYTPKLYMPDDDHVVISTVLYNLMNATSVQWEVVFAGIVICIIPTLIIFLLLQKYIYSGLVSGAVKE